MKEGTQNIVFIIISSFILVILFVAIFLVYSGRLVILDQPGVIDNNTNAIEYSEANNLDLFQSISEKHWNHMPLTYIIGTNCSERQRNLVLLAFKKIKEETDDVVSFEEAISYPDYWINCKDLEYAKDTDLTLGDAEYKTDNYNTSIITGAEINFYGQGMICGTGYPALELHEILHTFDFGHNPFVSSILNPYAADSSKDCDITEIDSEYVECLKYIYSDGLIGEGCVIENRYVEEETLPECDDGYYDVPGTRFCCPEPGMKVQDGLCFN